jgi:hypothetical protein
LNVAFTQHSQAVVKSDKNNVMAVEEIGRTILVTRSKEVTSAMDVNDDREA